MVRQGCLLANQTLLDPDLRSELELTSRHPSETEHAISKQPKLKQPKRAGFRNEGAAAYESRYRQHRIGRLAATAKELGYQLTPVSA